MQRIPPRSGERWCASWPPVSTPTRSGGRFGSAGIPSTAGLGIRDWRAGGFDALVPKPVPVHAAHPGRGAGVGGGAAPREPGPYRWGDPTDPARPAGWRPHSVAWPAFLPGVRSHRCGKLAVVPTCGSTGGSPSLFVTVAHQGSRRQIRCLVAYNRTRLWITIPSPMATT